LVIYKDYTEMQGQHNIKICDKVYRRMNKKHEFISIHVFYTVFVVLYIAAVIKVSKNTALKF